eukprot:COSAG01_NODE_29306_length_640_cov_3.380776_1_plen_87_part_01
MQEPAVVSAIKQFWGLMAKLSLRSSASAQTAAIQEVNREAYGELHLRVSKALNREEEWMDMEDGKHIANTDWVEDIRNFTGQATADV